MGLINEMSIDSQGGVCLKKHLSFYTYVKEKVGEVYFDITGYTNENYITGQYVLPYKNQNTGFTTDIYDISTCLLLETGTTMSDWVCSYINLLATSGYTRYDGSEIEDRIIYDQDNNNYYTVGVTGRTNVCGIDVAPKYAIVNNQDFELWDGTGYYYYKELDSCGVETGREIVATIDVNPLSSTFNNVRYVEKS